MLHHIHKYIFLCCCLKNLDGIHEMHSHSCLKQNNKISISEVMIQTRYRAQDSFAVYIRFRTCLFMLYLSTCMLHLNHRINLAIPMHDLSQYLNLFVLASTCKLQTNTLTTFTWWLDNFHYAIISENYKRINTRESTRQQ